MKLLAILLGNLEGPPAPEGRAPPPGLGEHGGPRQVTPLGPAPPPRQRQEHVNGSATSRGRAGSRCGGPSGSPPWRADTAVRVTVLVRRNTLHQTGVLSDLGGSVSSSAKTSEIAQNEIRQLEALKSPLTFLKRNERTAQENHLFVGQIIPLGYEMALLQAPTNGCPDP